MEMSNNESVRWQRAAKALSNAESARRSAIDQSVIIDRLLDGSLEIRRNNEKKGVAITRIEALKLIGQIKEALK